MPTSSPVSVILCTCNRSAALRQTLEALGRVRIPRDWNVELIVVDNASTDDTAIIVKNATLERMEVRYLHEPRKGKCHALNAGLALARGEFILFTDDDVLPSEEWLEESVAPMLNDSCDAMTGHLILAPHLMRPWLTDGHKMLLALSLDAQSRDWSRELIGATMGFRRAVLERVPGFDPELGPGPDALGFCEDTIFGWQVAQAGFRIEHVPKAVAIHQLNVSRLERRNWLGDATKRGRTQAYLRYHWKHDDIRFPWFKSLAYSMKLRLRRALQPPPPLEGEGCPLWEISYVMHMEMCRQFCLERHRPRNYSRRGLTKRVLSKCPTGRVDDGRVEEAIGRISR